MLCEIHAALKIKDGIDPKFVQEAISTGNTWALRSELPGIFEGGEAKEEVIKEVFDILDMWSFIEGSYSRFGKTDKDKVKTEAGPLGADVRFRGFDGNNETDHLSVARFLIDQMGRYSEFHKRNLNSHGVAAAGGIEAHAGILRTDAKFTQRRGIGRGSGDHSSKGSNSPVAPVAAEDSGSW